MNILLLLKRGAKTYATPARMDPAWLVARSLAEIRYSSCRSSRGWLSCQTGGCARSLVGRCFWPPRRCGWMGWRGWNRGDERCVDVACSVSVHFQPMKLISLSQYLGPANTSLSGQFDRARRSLAAPGWTFRASEDAARMKIAACANGFCRMCRLLF